MTKCSKCNNKIEKFTIKIISFYHCKKCNKYHQKSEVFNVDKKFDFKNIVNNIKQKEK